VCSSDLAYRFAHKVVMKNERMHWLIGSAALLACLFLIAIPVVAHADAQPGQISTAAACVEEETLPTP